MNIFRLINESKRMGRGKNREIFYSYFAKTNILPVTW